MVMKPIEVIKTLVIDNDNDKQLGELVRQYIKELNQSNENEARESWVCKHCGKNTYDVEWDYIGSDTNHLGCELEEEIKTKHFADGFHEGDWERD
tara:strand:- start:53 stop:337 length:285 start_codon:yes stop_codon:yes gene_type:complete